MWCHLPRWSAGELRAGDLDARLFPSSRDEVGQLTRAFNHMADQLREKVTTLAQEENQLSAILEGMADGVIITGDDGHVRLINPAAARVLGTTQASALGRSFAQVVRQHTLIDLWQRCQEQALEMLAEREKLPADRRAEDPLLHCTWLSRDQPPLGCADVLEDALGGLVVLRRQVGQRTANSDFGKPFARVNRLVLVPRKKEINNSE